MIIRFSLSLRSLLCWVICPVNFHSDKTTTYACRKNCWLQARDHSKLSLPIQRNGFFFRSKASVKYCF